LSDKLLEFLDDRWQVTILANSGSGSASPFEILELEHTNVPFERKTATRFVSRSRSVLDQQPTCDRQKALECPSPSMTSDYINELSSTNRGRAFAINKHRKFQKRKFVFTCINALPYLAFAEDPVTGAMTLTSGSEVPLILTLASTLNLT
jgi:hypothetical protein